MWTVFVDRKSGGCKQELWSEIYIEHSEFDNVEKMFETQFGHNPNDVACECCGKNYNSYEFVTLEEAAELFRNSAPLDTYMKLKTVLILYKGLQK